MLAVVLLYVTSPTYTLVYWQIPGEPCLPVAHWIFLPLGVLKKNLCG